MVDAFIRLRNLKILIKLYLFFWFYVDDSFGLFPFCISKKI